MSYKGISPKSMQALSVARSVEDIEECERESSVGALESNQKERERATSRISREEEQQQLVLGS